MKHALKWSIAALLAGNAADTASSWGKLEANPFLGQHQFDGRSTALKFGFIGALVGSELLYLKRHPKDEKVAAILNFSLGGAMVGVSLHNATIE